MEPQWDSPRLANMIPTYPQTLNIELKSMRLEAQTVPLDDS